jgi:hypothetical protein
MVETVPETDADRDDASDCVGQKVAKDAKQMIDGVPRDLLS